MTAPAAYPDESLPEGSVVAGACATTAIEGAYDYVVVGSGAAGAVAAHVLAQSGATVALVEEGLWIKTRDFGESVSDAFGRMFRDAGTQVMEGKAYIPVIQGRCVGGSTVVNSAIAHRTPEDVLGDWAARFGLGAAVDARALEPHFAALERELHASPVSDAALGSKDRAFLGGADARGLSARRTHRYEQGCEGSGRCFTGCPTAAKQGMNVSYVPWALAHGARIFVGWRVDRVVVRGGRAVGVFAKDIAHRRHDGGSPRPLTLHARRGVLVAASAVQTPNLLRRSGLRSPALGRHFQCHPGSAITGVFDDALQARVGATQGAESTSLRQTLGVKFETIALQPELAAVRIPGVGRALMHRFGVYSHLTTWAMVLRAGAEGVVDAAWGGRDRVRFNPSPSDMKRAILGVALLARMMFEAGAREVWPGLYGVPATLRSIDDVRAIDAMPADPRHFSFISTHLFGTARMGLDPRASVVGPDFQSHEVGGLYVVDSSVFPTNLGVNPQHSIMAISRLAATRLAAGRTRVNAAA